MLYYFNNFAYFELVKIFQNMSYLENNILYSI